MELPRVQVDEPNSPEAAPEPSRLRSLSNGALRWIWHQLVVAFSGPGLQDNQRGIDETQMPSGFIVPYKKGSRHVRNLSHLLF